MPSAQGITSAVGGTESADASVSTSAPRLLESVHVRRVRRGRGETAGADSRPGVTGGQSSMKFSHAVVGHFFFDFEFPDPVSEESEFLFNSLLARGAVHGSGMWAGHGKSHRGWNDVGRSGGCWSGMRCEFGVGGRGHEGSGLFVKVRSIILIISGVI